MSCKCFKITILSNVDTEIQIPLTKIVFFFFLIRKEYIKNYNVYGRAINAAQG